MNPPSLSTIVVFALLDTLYTLVVFVHILCSLLFSSLVSETNPLDPFEEPPSSHRGFT